MRLGYIFENRVDDRFRQDDIIVRKGLLGIGRSHRADQLIVIIRLFARQGTGTAAHFGLTDKIVFIMGTFSKSLASVGGFIASDRQTIEYLKHHSRAYIFSASLPASATAAALAALRIIRREPERIEHLWKVTHMMRQGLQDLGYDTRASETPTW